MKIIVVIPAFNEERHLKNVIEDVGRVVQDIIVVDDGSSDKSAEIAHKAGAIVLRHAINRGQGAALQTGNEYALMRGADIIVHFDADGQHKSGDIIRLAEPIISQKYDVVLGSKFLSANFHVPFFKEVFLLKPAIVLNRFLTGLNLSDVHNGLRAFSRKAAETIIITQDRMAHNTEIPAEIKKNKLRWCEVPVEIIYNEYGQGFSGGLEILKDLFLRKLIDFFKM